MLSRQETEVTVGSDHGFDRFFRTFRRAVASTDSLQDRVAEVVHGICDLNRDSFPDHETWDLFQALMAENASRAARNDKEPIAAPTSDLSDEEAAKWLQRAFGLFAEIAEEYGRQIS
jgi:hypothetical protein